MPGMQVQRVISAHLNQRELDMIPNINLGKNGHILTNRLLLKNERLCSYVNDSTMGALDSYAKHYDLKIFITPFENDLFHDLEVAVYQKDFDRSGFKFPIKLNEGRHALSDFITELHQNITKHFNNSQKNETGFSELA